jgi:hypothetical protein
LLAAWYSITAAIASKTAKTNALAPRDSLGTIAGKKPPKT